METYYRWELWLRSSAHHTIKQFVRRELMYSSWTEPVLPLLLQLPMPVALFCEFVQTRNVASLKSSVMHSASSLDVDTAVP